MRHTPFTGTPYKPRCLWVKNASGLRASELARLGGHGEVGERLEMLAREIYEEGGTGGAEGGQIQPPPLPVVDASRSMAVVTGCGGGSGVEVDDDAVSVSRLIDDDADDEEYRFALGITSTSTGTGTHNTNHTIPSLPLPSPVDPSITPVTSVSDTVIATAGTGAIDGTTISTFSSAIETVPGREQGEDEHKGQGLEPGPGQVSGVEPGVVPEERFEQDREIEVLHGCNGPDGLTVPISPSASTSTAIVVAETLI